MQVIVFTPEEYISLIEEAASKAVEKFINAKQNANRIESFISPEQFGKEHGKHAGTVRRWIHSGKIKGYKIAGQLMIDRDEANAMIRQKIVKVHEFPEA